jgi:uncharacterized protein YdaT
LFDYLLFLLIKNIINNNNIRNEVDKSNTPSKANALFGKSSILKDEKINNIFSQSPKKASPLATSKLAPAYYYQNLHEEQISHHKKHDFTASGISKDLGSQNGSLYKSSFISNQKKKNSNADENENNTSLKTVNNGKKFTGKNSTILDFLIKK